MTDPGACFNMPFFSTSASDRRFYTGEGGGVVIKASGINSDDSPHLRIYGA